jgi:arginase
MNNRRIKVIEVPSELGAGTRGSSLGPTALRFADMNKGRKKINKFLTSRVGDLNYMLGKPTAFEHAKNIDSISTVINAVALEVEKSLSEGDFPLIFSGDHSNAAGSIAGIKNYYDNKRLGVIWVDAHADIHTPLTTPSGNVHGMPMAVSLGIDNTESAINELDENTMEYWNELKYAGSKGISPKILPQDIMYIDIRDLERQEWDVIDKLGIEFYTPKEVKEYGIERVAKETLEYLKDCDIIYVSFDVDSLDPAVSVGTGTPYPEGLNLYEAKTLLYNLLRDPKTIALEITEINPLLDTENKMARAALEILEEVL